MRKAAGAKHAEAAQAICNLDAPAEVADAAFFFFLPGIIPSKKNSRITDRRTGRSFPSALYKEWHRLSTRSIPKVSVPGPVSVRISFLLPNKRVRDLTNMAESIMDLLVDCSVIDDDRWTICRSVTLRSALNPSRPGAMVEIRSYTDAD